MILDFIITYGKTNTEIRMNKLFFYFLKSLQNNRIQHSNRIIH